MEKSRHLGSFDGFLPCHTLFFFLAENHEDLFKIHNEDTDRILLEGLKIGLSVNKSTVELSNMTEKDLMDYLMKEDYEQHEFSINISVPPVKPEYPENARNKTKVMILPLSLEDELQTCGIANVLKEFTRDLSIDISKK